ncbi:MAG: hypothetical protein IOC59_01500 [Methylobacterium sp.]|nr:hypothetical protein [Methylobacterium sp.]MCA3602406.1 hypothetical protein [Methylobacterium sp.]MCA3613876.1 hypothetical protein [Methylobacterium sp.]MCA3627059.1 hypothetical protein [Methylobacterium sp.]
MAGKLACAKRFLVVLALAGAGQISGTSLLSARENCEQFKSPFQYNECLARQAPGHAARSSRINGTGGADPEATVPARRRHAGAGTEARSGVALQRHPSGRVRAVIDPWSGARNVTAGKTRRR